MFFYTTVTNMVERPEGIKIASLFILGIALLVGAIAFLFIAIGVFRLGLRRYESGSAIQVEV